MEASPTPAIPPTPPSAAAAVPAVNAVAPIVYEDFAKIELRVGTVLECKAHPNGDKLWVLQVDLGTEKRQICAGLRQFVAAEELVGKQIVVVANLEPRKLRGEVSQGMLLAASDPVTGKVVVLSPSNGVAAGSRVS